ncbi:CynX/NimT family MFS transporter [Rhodococcus sp. NPDC060086]|uniref:MFS transporter n=1 Tax=unclassified Rhodococcus (in: high G+C Gram-positive bacteria) TaxID=192944 RepID=UPI00365D5EC7
MTVPSDGSAADSRSAESEPRSLWRGRLLLIVGIVLLGISLRSAVTGMSPFLPEIREDLGMGAAAATLLGMLPTLFFGAAGFAAPVLIRRTSLELTASVAMILAAVGLFARSVVGGVPLFLILSAVALFGMGMGNVVGAPLVKKYFPDRPAPMLTTFALLMQAGATIPAMLALPLADAGGGWRFSIGSWALLSAVAAVPWIVQLIKVSRTPSTAWPVGLAAAAEGENRLGMGQLLRNPIAVGTALFYAMASLNTYAMLAWMPTIFQDSGHDETVAATAFSIFTFLTLPMALVSPLVGSKLRNPFPYAAALTLLPAIGFLGMALAPGIPMLWAVLTGFIGGAFPLAIAMFNRRTRTEQGSGSLAGFAMGVGYLFGTLGPLLGGWLDSATGSWKPALLVYAVTAVPMLIGAWQMSKPDRYLEDGISRE